MKRKMLILIITVFALIITIIMSILVSKSTKNNNLFIAIDNNDLDAVKIAIEKGADVNAYRHPFLYKELGTTNPTPLILACKKGNEDIVKFLVESGADINKKDKFTGQTPLLATFHGAKQNRFKLAKYLIDNGADIYISQPTSTVIHNCIYISKNDNEYIKDEGFSLFKYLIDKDIELEIGPENALTYAAHYNNLNVVKYLIDNKYYDVDSIDSNGNTALIVATQYGRIEIVEFLLEKNANKRIANFEGKIAYDYALEKKLEYLTIILS